MQNIFALKITDLKGIGEKRAELFEKQGICSLYDLLTYYPSDYDDRRHFTTIDKLQEGETACIVGWVRGRVRTFRKGRSFSVSSGTLADETGTMSCVWYNQPYMEKNFKTGEIYIFYGKAQKSKSGLQFVNPVAEKAEEENAQGKIVPIYSLGKGLGAKTLQKLLVQAVENYAALVPESIPESVLNKYDLLNIRETVENIHFPKNYELLERARKRVVFEEFFLFQMCVAKMKYLGKKDGITFQNVTNDFENRLPFTLTDAQKKVVVDLKRDFQSGYAMNRLVQGDVGSGKTMVAAYGMYIAVQNGYQAALMAPTEILAGQHFKTFKNLFPDLNVELLTSSTTAKEKKRIKSALESGEIHMIIGTHALIQQDIVFSNLGFVVTDEQHRFGVVQRTKLGLKGLSPHVLVMTATPIPRTLGLILYGDLDISTIDALPPGRQKIKTYCVNESFRNRVYDFMDKQIADGAQAYVVCPLVEETESMDVKDATSFAESLKARYPHLKIGLLHGKMKDAEKEKIMEAFSKNEISVLVATTVVEVGVDVPNASVMIIENAERFGLSQLHQLRGRVGRGTRESHCILFGATRNPETIERLKVIESSTDGFYISEKDLELRGPGDFFGTRQSGVPMLKSANPMTDTELLYKAKEAVEDLLCGELKAEKNEKQFLNFILKKQYFRMGVHEILN